MKYWLILAFLGIALLFSNCGEDGRTNLIPLAFVSEDINLNEIQNQALRQPGGYIYINAGYKGIILYHDGFGSYSAFERTCTYNPFADCDPVVVDSSGLFMIHRCCSSTYSFEGFPMGGPAPYELKKYRIYQEGIYLLIRSE